MFLQIKPLTQIASVGDYIKYLENKFSSLQTSLKNSLFNVCITAPKGKNTTEKKIIDQCTLTKHLQNPVMYKKDHI